MITSILKNILSSSKTRSIRGEERPSTILQAKPDIAVNATRSVLNVGGNSKDIPIPDYFTGWEHLLLDIDPRGHPDIVCDARQLRTLPALRFNAIYCSHNLEHYFRHDVAKVLAGFHHVLRDDGFADIRVPDMGGLIKILGERSMDIDDFLYDSPAGPIHAIDMIYGLGREIEESGNDFFAHKTGFTEKSLLARLHESGFETVFTAASNLEIRAIAFKKEPSDFAINLLGIADVPR